MEGFQEPIERRIDRMTSATFAEAIKSCGTLIIPLGSVEETGNHCPLGTDLFVAESASLRIAEKANCLVSPPIPFGDTYELDFWPGNVHVDAPILGAYIEAVARSFVRQGFKNIVFFCCHSLTMKCVDLLCRRLNREGVKVCAIDWWKVAVDVARGETSSAEPFGHGGEVITSIALALEPDLVQLTKATDEPSLPALSRINAHSLGSPFIEYADFRKYCISGAWGAVRATASQEKGERWLLKAISAAADFIQSWRENNS